MKTVPSRLLLILALSALAVTNAAWARDLTFEERVAAQEAIERVYYSHQIGATLPFEEAMPREILEKKVRTYLKQSAALQQLWQTPVTEEALQNELERIVHHTRMPVRLGEITRALGDDRFLLLECLARATLVDRLARRFFSADERIHGQARREAERLRDVLASGGLSLQDEEPHRSVAVISLKGSKRVGSQIGRGGPTEFSSPKDAAQIELDEEDFLQARAAVPARAGEIGPVIDEDEAFVARAVLFEGYGLISVASYRVRKVTWDEWWQSNEAGFDEEAISAVSSDSQVHSSSEATPDGLGSSCVHGDAWDSGTLDDVPPPEPRFGHSAVWTGSVMIVWGGFKTWYVNTGKRYDPTTDNWSPIAGWDGDGSMYHTAVWTGRKMLVWGGLRDPRRYNLWYVGGIYDPVADNWRYISNSREPSLRFGHTAVWTGTLMIIWGGQDPVSRNFLSSGAAYDPNGNYWWTMSGINAPEARAWQTAIWTGSDMVVWGGTGASGDLGTGGRYRLSGDTWTPISTTSAPAARTYHSAIWTGNEMVVWGGSAAGGALATGGRYDPASDSWSAMRTTGAPGARFRHTAVWTGSSMLVWGGSTGPLFLQTGGRYDPSADAWSPMSALNAPSARMLHSAVWTGTLMLVWGGQSDPKNFYSPLSSGARYDPAADSWTPIQATPAQPGRSRHSAVWTGSLMIVWGGASHLLYDDPDDYSGTGGRYDPVTDSWSPTSLFNAPLPRLGNSAIWTGTEMIIFGGDRPLAVETHTGALYYPGWDLWVPMSTVNAPYGDGARAAVWTGKEMIVWGGSQWTPRDSGGRYNPRTDTWRTMSGVNAPSRRYYHASVWTGKEMIVWGGNESYAGNTGGRYNPETDTWSPTPLTGAPRNDGYPIAVWTGRDMIVWSPWAGSGARYNPEANAWSPISGLQAPPAGLDAPAAVWTGREMLVLGGDPYGQPHSSNAGWRYNPAADGWTSTSTAGAPEGRRRASLIWTGNSAILWGGESQIGQYYSVLVLSGGRYFPDEIRLPATADAGPDRAVECSAPDRTPVTLSATGTGCGGGPAALTYTWTGPFPEGDGTIQGEFPTVTLPMGSSTLTLSVEDSWGQGATDSVTVSVRDTTRPVLTCPSRVMAECESADGTFVTIPVSGVSDRCDPAPAVRNSQTANGADFSGVYPLGQTRVSLTATDASGNIGICYSSVIVQDTTPPNLSCPGRVVAECATPAGALVGIEATVTDACSPSVQIHNDRTPGGGDASDLYPLGVSRISFSAADASGNTRTCTSSVTVQDSTPPQIAVSLSPGILWPPNHRMVDVEASVAATDACSTPTVILTSVSSSEADDAPGGGDGSTTGDIQGAQVGTPAFGLQLRAERDGAGEGRAYRVTYLAVDGWGNQASASSIVLVPHDLGGGTEPILISTDVDSGGTVLRWDPVQGASTYRVIRGEIEGLHDAGDFIDLGSVSCILSASASTSTQGREDAEVPPLGEAFFYLVSYDDGQDSGYGSDTAAKPRVKTGGGCE